MPYPVNISEGTPPHTSTFAQQVRPVVCYLLKGYSEVDLGLRGQPTHPYFKLQRLLLRSDSSRTFTSCPIHFNQIKSFQEYTKKEKNHGRRQALFLEPERVKLRGNGGPWVAKRSVISNRDRPHRGEAAAASAVICRGGSSHE
jgi:hypothetical protein